MPTDLKELLDQATLVEPRALIVDDDPALLQLMTRWLSNRGVTIETARSGLEALNILRNSDGCQVVVADQQMPGMSGLTLLDIVRKQWPDCQRVLYTGHADSDLVLAAVGHKVLTKQMDMFLVRDAIIRLAKVPR